MPGFEKKNIKLSLNGRILSIEACKEVHKEKKHDMICNQRPNIIDKKMRLPVEPKEESIISAKYEQGVLTVTIPIQKQGKDIKVD